MRVVDVIAIGTMMGNFSAMRVSTILVLALLVFAGGCSTSDIVKRPVPIAGGKVVGVLFGARGPLPATGNGYEVIYATTVPGTIPTDVVYKFAFIAPPGTNLQRVTVDDISDEQSSAMIDDLHPWLEENAWHGEMKPLDRKDPLLAWVYTVTPSMRVFRFTITDVGGKQTVLYQLTVYQPFIKSAMRYSWGEKY